MDRDTAGQLLVEGPYVGIEVSDDGCGIDPATMKRIFEPFFTTKFPGRGLGLAAVDGIARRLNGRVTVVSAPGRGARFRVWLPVPATGPTDDR